MKADPKSSLARSIVAAGAMVAGGLFWLGYRVGVTPSPHAAPAPPPTTAAAPTNRPNEGASPSPLTPPVEPAALLARDAFDAAWQGESQAADACWERARDSVPLPPAVHLFVVVRPDGSVSDVSFRQPLPPPAQALSLCAARIVKELRVEPARDTRKGEIQLWRPGVK